MPSLKRSNEHKTFSDIKQIFEERIKALKHYFDRIYVSELVGYPPSEAKKLAGQFLSDHLQEAGYDSSLVLFGAIEAAFRLDFANRCEKRGKDSRSKAARQLSESSRRVFDFRIPLDKLIDLLDIDQYATQGEINLLKRFFKYRHWLAHGRYWSLKLGMTKPTFHEIYQLIEKIQCAFDS